MALVAAAAAASVVAVSSPAFAATWSVTQGGTVSATNAASTTFTDSTTHNSVTCTTASLHGTIANGTGLLGPDIGQITGASFTSCTGSGFSFTVTSKFPPNSGTTEPNDGNWDFNAVSYNATTGVTTGTLTNIQAHLASVANICTFDVAGPGPTLGFDGSVDGTYNNNTGVLTSLGTGNLKVYNASSGCGSLVHTGDAGTFNGSYTVVNTATPPTHPQITSP
jgi:hypothetical protein